MLFSFESDHAELPMVQFPPEDREVRGFRVLPHNSTWARMEWGRIYLPESLALYPAKVPVEDRMGLYPNVRASVLKEVTQAFAHPGGSFSESPFLFLSEPGHRGWVDLSLRGPQDWANMVMPRDLRFGGWEVRIWRSFSLVGQLVVTPGKLRILVGNESLQCGTCPTEFLPEITNLLKVTLFGIREPHDISLEEEFFHRESHS